MKKEKLLELGLSEEQSEAVLGEYKEVIKGFVPLDRLSEVTKAKKKLETDLAERDKQLKDLEGIKGNSEELQAKIRELQEQNKTAKAQYEADMKKLKVDNAVKSALTAAGAKNLKAVTALLDIDDTAELDDDGNVKGLADKIKALTESDGYLFESRGSGLKGLRPGQSSDGLPTVDLDKMTYTELIDYQAANPGVQI